MAKRKAESRGGDLADRLLQGIHEERSAPLPGARELPVLRSLDPTGACLCPMENVLMQVTEILVKSQRMYIFGNSVVMEVDLHDGTGPRLLPLRTGGRTEVGAEKWMGNLFVCEYLGNQFPPPKAFTDVLLRAEPMMASLPRIETYARRPVFDKNFVLRGPGWHHEAGILVHGPSVEPILNQPAARDIPALHRLPTHLRTVLGGFCFAGPADLANTVGLFLTGVLSNRFTTVTKPVALLDGNQPGVGKTLLGRTNGMVLDGVDPRLIHYTTEEEELQKRICATIRESRQSVLIIDNAKVKGGAAVESATIEANSMAPEISLRILGRSENYTRPNDLLWLITMNCTRASADLVSRGLPIRQSYEGDPRNRTFSGPDPIAYAEEYRLAILGELVGMIIRWNQLGRPDGSRSHRCTAWARVVGGILEANGFAEFLSNYGEAAASFSSAMDELAALAEAAVGVGGEFVTVLTPDQEEGN